MTATTIPRWVTPEREEEATPIWWPLRAWMAVEVLFGLLSILTIALFPDQTATNFAWAIQPDVMAATLGAFYIATAILFVVPLFARTWQSIRATIVPTAVFSAAMLLATVIHWDKFSRGTGPFAVWLASYALPPPIFAALYWWHQRRSAPVGVGVARPVAGWIRTFLRGNGWVLAGLAVLLFIVPAPLQTIAPWALTPLTARALCGWLIGVGLLQVWLSWEGDWQRMRLGTTTLIILPPALILQIVRFASQVRWDTVALWVLLADLTVVAAVLSGLWLTSGRWPSRGPALGSSARTEDDGRRGSSDR